MRHIKRLPKPNILAEKEQEWLDNFIKSGKNRPDNSKYGHKEILETLNLSSRHKCFYCETILKDLPKEIDHFIEVSYDKTKAFEWENLYLACENCNNKIPNDKIPVKDVLNPCVDDDTEIKEHIFFEKNLIQFHTTKGDKTIQKFKLSTEKLDKLRETKLREFVEFLLKIKDKMIEKGKKKMSEKQKQKIKQYASTQCNYSLMFEQYINKI